MKNRCEKHRLSNKHVTSDPHTLLTLLIYVSNNYLATERFITKTKCTYELNVAEYSDGNTYASPLSVPHA